MDETETHTSSLEYTYKEYVRLSERCASYVQSSFDDFKIYGASGLVFALKPIADAKFENQIVKNRALFFGFLSILLFVFIFIIFNLLKQSLVVYYLIHLRAYEAEIKAELGQESNAAFRWSESYSKWRKKIVIPIAVRLYMVVGLAIIVFPIIVLAWDTPRWYASVYGLVSLSLIGIYLSAAKIFLKE